MPPHFVVNGFFRVVCVRARPDEITLPVNEPVFALRLKNEVGGTGEVTGERRIVELINRVLGSERF